MNIVKEVFNWSKFGVNTQWNYIPNPKKPLFLPHAKKEEKAGI